MIPVKSGLQSCFRDSFHPKNSKTGSGSSRTNAVAALSNHHSSPPPPETLEISFYYLGPLVAAIPPQSSSYHNFLDFQSVLLSNKLGSAPQGFDSPEFKLRSLFQLTLIPVPPGQVPPTPTDFV